MNIKSMVVCTMLALASVAAAGDKSDGNSPQTKPAKARPVTLAVLDYEIKMPGSENLGSQMADILTVRLSIDGAVRLVERAKLGKIMAEQKLKLVGVVDQDQAVKIGKLVGERML